MEHRRGRVTIVVILLVGLALATVMRQVAANQRGSTHLAASTPLSRMNSYALALLLGGLRGPLVMFLWPSSEGQKSEKNLEDFDTKVEWIRLLQAEFDTVHIFQIWNKAYNISVLMANPANKYATILDALDYAHQVDAERPNNINMLSAIAGIFGEKLGGSAEKNYYKSRVREETRAREPLVRVTFPGERRNDFADAAQAAGATPANLAFVPDEDTDAISVTVRKSIADAMRATFDGPGITYADRPRAARVAGMRRTELDPMLDAEGNLLDELVRPRPARRAGSNDGSELQYLKPFEPFPYGLSAHALDYNYRKRAQVLLREANQHHAQLSDLVVDSRPALSLRNWSDDEWERGRRAEAHAFGLPLPVPNERAPTEPEERLEMEGVAARLNPAAPVANPAALDEAIFSYERAAAAAAEALREYNVHLEKHRTNLMTYQSHQEELAAQAALVRGDADFLKLVRGGAGADRSAMAQRAAEHYRDAVRRYQGVLLARYIEDPQVKRFFPPDVTRDTVQQLPPEQIAQIADAVWDEVQRAGGQASLHFDEWQEMYAYVQRAAARLAGLQRVAPAQ